MSSAKLMLRAENFCASNKHRLTEPRIRVLSVLADSSIPLGAYQIIKALSANREPIKPPTVYRAIAFWNKYGFIHRVESMNAYVACCEHQHHKNCCVFICNQCQSVIELPMRQLPPPVMNEITHKQLTLSYSTTELHGLCAECRHQLT